MIDLIRMSKEWAFTKGSYFFMLQSYCVCWSCSVTWLFYVAWNHFGKQRFRGSSTKWLGLISLILQTRIQVSRISLCRHRFWSFREMILLRIEKLAKFSLKEVDVCLFWSKIYINLRKWDEIIFQGRTKLSIKNWGFIKKKSLLETLLLTITTRSRVFGENWNSSACQVFLQSLKLYSKQLRSIWLKIRANISLHLWNHLLHHVWVDIINRLKESKQNFSSP